MDELALRGHWPLGAGPGSCARGGTLGCGCSRGKSYFPNSASQGLGSRGAVLGARPTTLLLVSLDATHVHPLDDVAVFALVSAPFHLLTIFLTCVEIHFYLRLNVVYTRLNCPTLGVSEFLTLRHSIYHLIFIMVYFIQPMRLFLLRD